MMQDAGDRERGAGVGDALKLNRHAAAAFFDADGPACSEQPRDGRSRIGHPRRPPETYGSRITKVRQELVEGFDAHRRVLPRRWREPTLIYMGKQSRFAVT